MTMEQNKKSRITYIAQAQLIGCLLVVLGHSVPLNWQIPQAINTADTFLYIFHMPLFFFVSGYLFYKTSAYQRYTYLKYIKKRSVRLIVPYVAMTLIGIIPKILTKSYFNNGGELSFFYIFKNFGAPRENVWGHLWFLPTLFLISFSSFLLAKAKNKSYLGYSIIMLVSLCLPVILPVTTWFAIDDIIKYFCFYALGMFFAGSTAERFFEKHYKCFLLGLPIAIVAFFFYNKNKVLDTFIGEIIAVSMLFFVLTITSLFDVSNTRIGKFLIKKTYSIYLLSWPFQCIISLVFEKILKLPYYITMPIAFVAGILGPIVTILIVDWIENKANKRFISPIIGG